MLSCPANIYLFKINNGNTRKSCELYLKLTIETIEQPQWRHFDVFIVNFEHISLLFLVFLLLISHKWMLVRSIACLWKTVNIEHWKTTMSCSWKPPRKIFSLQETAEMFEFLYHASWKCRFLLKNLKDLANYLNLENISGKYLGEFFSELILLILKTTVPKYIFSRSLKVVPFI